MVKIQENVDINDYSTFKIKGGKFRYFAVINKREDLPQIYAIAQKYGKENNLPIFILGGGSNTIFSDGVVDIIALKNEIKGLEIVKDEENFIEIKVNAGEVLDKFIEKSIDMSLSGLESLSAIPGTVGATPVQNVGAYGREVKDVITSVEVFDTISGEFKNLSNEDCCFGYRDSIFKNEAKGRYIITAVVFRLEKVKDNSELIKKRKEITETRWSKLPKPEEIPNVGSFFKNPIVSKELADKILKDYPDAKFFPVDEYHTKVPAGWLMEMAGLKGKSFGEVAVYDKNALILINKGKATKEDIIKAKNEIIKTIKDKFGIELEQEPEII